MRIWIRRLPVAWLLAGALLLAACATEGETDPESTAADVEQPDEEADLDEEPAAAEDDEEPVDEPTDTLPDTPQAYAALTVEGADPAIDDSGAVTLILGAPDGQLFPFVAYNGTAAPVSRIEVSGRAVDADGNTLGSGSSQSVEPNVVAPGGVAFGIVWIGEELPDGATLDDAQVDYTDGLGQYENIVQIDIDQIEFLEGQITGTVSNPHDIEVSGPISVGVVCLGGDGIPTKVVSSYTDRDDVQAGGTSTFSMMLFDPLDCAGTLAGSSGYDM